MNATPHVVDTAPDTAPEPARTPPHDLDALATYFDTTDASTLPWEDADVAIERPDLAQISLRLPKEDLAALKRRAARAGVGYTTLIRMIVRQHLRNPLTR